MKLPTYALCLSLLISGCMGGPVGNTAVPQPAQSVELSKYLGRWYELARYEASFQKDCEAVTADYSLNADGTIKVLNACRQDAVDGAPKSATGEAYVVEGTNNAKLRISFFWPFYGNYWVLDHAADYSWSIVGEPSGKYLWILSREAKVSEAQMVQHIQRVKDLGYNTELLRITKH